MNDNELSLLRTFLEDQYLDLKNNHDGKVADYIPQLAKQDPNSFAVSVCTVEGQEFHLGDVSKYFCIQSCSKPFVYCYARHLHGLEKVHHHVGYEPSGASFNAFVLNNNHLPHNPMINAGAIMVASLVHTADEPAERFDRVLQMMNRTAGADAEEAVLFDNSVYLSEKHHADRNISLAYYMRENKAFGDPNPTPSEVQDHLDLYFQTCSIQITNRLGARMAGTLANGGICPKTGETVFSTDTAKDCLTLMYSCGMYDFSGQFGFEVGLPAKSGVAGCVMLIVPGRFGMCIWSPPLDRIGNSVRGVELCRRLSAFGPGDYHMFRHNGNSKKTHNPDYSFYQFMDACKDNDRELIESLIVLVNINRADYDGRTALHIVGSEGNESLYRYLVERGAEEHLRDRWGNTAEDELLKKKYY